jgi:type I restriction enzyme R subunit
MPGPGEHKTVKARILAYAQEIGWAYVSRDDAEARRGFDPDGATPEDRARLASLYFDDLLHSQVLTFNPKYKEAEGALSASCGGSTQTLPGNSSTSSSTSKPC